MKINDIFVLVPAIIIPIISIFAPAGEINSPYRQDRTAEVAMLEINSSNDGVKVPDLLDCRLMVGKSAEENGIPENVIDKSLPHLAKTYADGEIFGKEDYGIVYFSGENASAVTSVWIHIKQTDFDECRELLSALYGEPYSVGEHPYVISNGGAVSWADFRDGGIRIRLSSASEREYSEIEFSLFE